MDDKTIKYGMISLILILLIFVFAFNNGGLDSGSYLLMAILFFPLFAFIMSLIFKKK